MDGEHYLLPTTVDNPYNPFNDWDRWYLEDIRLGYDTCGLWARLTPPIGELDEGSEEEGLRLLAQYNFSGKHILVTPMDYSPEFKPIQ